MDNPSGTTEQPMLSMEDRLYGEPSEPETDSADAEVEETAEQEVTAETTDEVDAVEDEQEGEEATEETESETDDESEQVFVTKDGKEVTLKELHDGYLRQSDYTKKTQAIAEERKAIETAKAEIAPRLQILKDIESELGTLILGDFANVDWAAIRDSDPSQYLALKEAKEQREQAINNLKAKRDQLAAEQAQGEAAKLHESLGWSNPDARNGDIGLIQNYVKANEIPDEVFASVTNHKLMTALLKAAKYDQLQSKKPDIVRKVKQAPKQIGKPAKAAESAPLSLADRMYGRKSS